MKSCDPIDGSPSTIIIVISKFWRVSQLKFFLDYWHEKGTAIATHATASRLSREEIGQISGLCQFTALEPRAEITLKKLYHTIEIFSH